MPTTTKTGCPVAEFCNGLFTPECSRRNRDPSLWHIAPDRRSSRSAVGAYRTRSLEPKSAAGVCRARPEEPEIRRWGISHPIAGALEPPLGHIAPDCRNSGSAQNLPGQLGNGPTGFGAPRAGKLLSIGLISGHHGVKPVAATARCLGDQSPPARWAGSGWRHRWFHREAFSMMASIWAAGTSRSSPRRMEIAPAGPPEAFPV